jgi:hypothetical protein
MAVHKCRSARGAKHYAEEAREKGFRASTHGHKVYVSRK